jgi:hypothetical protein
MPKQPFRMPDLEEDVCVVPPEGTELPELPKAQEESLWAQASSEELESNGPKNGDRDGLQAVQA